MTLEVRLMPPLEIHQTEMLIPVELIATTGQINGKSHNLSEGLQPDENHTPQIGQLPAF
jgi:hypothetical protein